MNPNTDRASNGAEVYRHEIHRLADEYVSTLEDPGAIYNPQTSFFNGMIKYIE